MTGPTVTLAGTVATLIRQRLGLDTVLGPNLVLTQSSTVLVTVTPYTLTENDLTGQDLMGVQVRVRGKANGGNTPVWNAQDAIRELLVDQVAVPGTVTCWRNSSSAVVFDSADRPEVFDTYYVRTDRLGKTG